MISHSHGSSTELPASDGRGDKTVPPLPPGLLGLAPGEAGAHHNWRTVGYSFMDFNFRPDDIIRVVTALPPGPDGQSGRCLKEAPVLSAMLADVTAKVSMLFDRPMYLRLDKSSCRIQPPNGAGKLGLHQDYLPMQDVLTSRLHFDGGFKKFIVGLKEGLPYLTNPAREPCCTVWLPLHDIDEQTPTLEISRVAAPDFIPHKTDPAGYAVLRDEGDYAANVKLDRLSSLPQGRGVIFGPLTLHRSCVLPHHTKSRTSMDLRFLPRRMPKGYF